MEIVLKIFLFHIISMTLFIVIYYNMSNAHFVNSYDKKKIPTTMDYVYFGASVTCGSGLSPIYANTDMSKMLVCVQQIIALGVSVVMVFFFIKHHVIHHVKHHVK